MEVPIRPDARPAIDEARELLASGQVIRLSRIECLMCSPYPEVKCVVCSFVFEHPDKIEGVLGEWRTVSRLCLPLLLDCIRDNSENDFRFGRFESLRYLKWLFVRLWDGRTQLGDDLVHLRNSLADVCRAAGPVVVDDVVTGLLEHLFCNRDYAAFFSSWREDPALADVFGEASRLAAGFKELGGTDVGESV